MTTPRDEALAKRDRAPQDIVMYLRELVREVEAGQFVQTYVELDGVLWPQWAAMFDLLDSLMSRGVPLPEDWAAGRQ